MARSGKPSKSSKPAARSRASARRAEATASVTAKVFTHGRSQAVKLPKGFRFEGSEVRIHREGNRVIIEPVTKPPFDLDRWMARMLATGSGALLPDDLPDDDVSLD